MSILKALRNSRNKTQNDIADMLGITRPAYANIENGKRQIDNNNLVALAEYYGVSTDYILGRSEDIKDKQKEPIVDPDDELRARAIASVQKLSDPALIRVLDFLAGMKAGQGIEEASPAGCDPNPESAE